MGCEPASLMAEGTGWGNLASLGANLLIFVAEEAGFEPAVVIRYAGFQDQCHQPLGHPSVFNYITKMIKNIILML